MSTDDKPEKIPRCAVTGHPVGTDTWVKGSVCPCLPCQIFVLGLPLTHLCPGTFTNKPLVELWQPRPVEHFYL